MSAISNVGDSISEVFGYAVPGYALLAMFLLPFAFLFRDIAQLLGIFAAAAGLPVGFLWVYALYHPFIWGRSQDGTEWRKFLVQAIGMDLMNQIGRTKHLTSIQQRNLTLLQQDQARLFQLVDRLSSQLREDSPFLAFFHVRHHTLRNLAYVLRANAVVYSILFVALVIRQATCCFNASSVWLVWLLLLTIVLFLWLTSSECLNVAHEGFLTTRRTYGLRFAQNRRKIVKQATLMLDAPFFAQATE